MFGTYHYLKLISKYWEKNQVGIKKGIVFDEFPPLETAVRHNRQQWWFKLFFELCGKVDTIPTKNDFEQAMKHDFFKQISKECQSMIKENYQKLYPNA